MPFYPTIRFNCSDLVEVFARIRPCDYNDDDDDDVGNGAVVTTATSKAIYWQQRWHLVVVLAFLHVVLWMN